jgi:hypothetical protein
MGGLVVKKVSCTIASMFYTNATQACILRTSIPRYNGISQSTIAIMFLSTPHYGSNLADWLRLVLGFSPLGHAPQPYVFELGQNSLTLREINNQFLSLAPRPAVASFYETLETGFGPLKTVCHP